MRLRRRRADRRGAIHAVTDDDTVEGFAPRSLFVRCTARSDLWHLAARQSLALVVPKSTLCGIRPYMAQASTRSTWSDVEGVSVCTTCRSLAVDF